MEVAADIGLFIIVIALVALAIYNSLKDKPYQSKLQCDNRHNCWQERDAAARRGYANVDQYIVAKRNGTARNPIRG